MSSEFVVAGLRISTCRGCDAEIVWATTELGKPIPVDVEPVADGNLALRLLPGLDAPVAHVLGPDEQQGDDARFQAHFASCPKADTFRRRRAA